MPYRLQTNRRHRSDIREHERRSRCRRLLYLLSSFSEPHPLALTAGNSFFTPKKSIIPKWRCTANSLVFFFYKSLITDYQRVRIIR